MLRFFCVVPLSLGSTLLPVHDESTALQLMKASHVVFGGTCRNVAKYLLNNLLNIDRAGQLFASYHVVIYENDSKDQTRQILIEHAFGRPEYHLIFEDNVPEPARTMRLARGRNKVLDAARGLNISEPAYLVILDLDDINSSGCFVESLPSCFKYTDWDALFGNQLGDYYDSWPLRQESGWVDYSVVTWGVNRPRQEELTPVKSAFGGLAIYRMSSIPPTAHYTGFTCEHVSFHTSMIEGGSDRLFINTNLLTDCDCTSCARKPTTVILRLIIAVIALVPVFGIFLLWWKLRQISRRK